ncbi:MAG: sugar ABC transporter permease [Planctomycetes bacterium]|nr:sugar ABC transporter permease [Planctomycetota bacterium]
MLPILLINFIVVIGPTIASVYYSMTDWNGVGSANFIGLENYRKMIFESMTVRKAFTNNLEWLILFQIVPTSMALLAASLLVPIKRGAMFFRAAIFIPYILPSVINASIWRNLLSPTLGVGAQLAKIGIPGLDYPFLGDPITALLTVAFVDNWHYWGFVMVVFLTSMQSVPVELYDAAKIDGANRFQEFKAVTLPGIRPTLIFMMLMSAIWSFLVFDYIWVLTQGGPGGASEVLGVVVFKTAFYNFEAGYAAAIGLSMSLLAGLIILIFLLLRKRGWEI